MDVPTLDRLLLHGFLEDIMSQVSEVSELKTGLPTPRLATIFTPDFRHSTPTPRSTSDSVGVSKVPTPVLERPALINSYKQYFPLFRNVPKYFSKRILKMNFNIECFH